MNISCTLAHPADFPCSICNPTTPARDQADRTSYADDGNWHYKCYGSAYFNGWHWVASKERHDIDDLAPEAEQGHPCNAPNCGGRWGEPFRHGWEIDRMLERLTDTLTLRNAQLFEARQALERAYCNGKGYSPEYGWPVGDQIPETMADAIIDKRAELTREITRHRFKYLSTATDANAWQAKSDEIILRQRAQLTEYGNLILAQQSQRDTSAEEIETLRARIGVLTALVEAFTKETP